MLGYDLNHCYDTTWFGNQYSILLLSKFESDKALDKIELYLIVSMEAMDLRKLIRYLSWWYYDFMLIKWTRNYDFAVIIWKS